jgi:H+/Cl- antiporter ClcA
MSFFDGVWHLLGFAAVPVLLGLLAALAAKLVWRHGFRAQPWWRLALTTTVASLCAALIGLIVTGKDGAMLTYGAMVIACAVTLWWPIRHS